MTEDCYSDLLKFYPQKGSSHRSYAQEHLWLCLCVTSLVSRQASSATTEIRNLDVRAVGFTPASQEAGEGYLSRGPRKGRRWTTHRLGCPPRERKRLTLTGTYLRRRGDDVPWNSERNDVP